MGAMVFSNNGLPRWEPIVDSQGRKKNKGCSSKSDWGGTYVTKLTHTATASYKKVGTFGTVECDIVCTAEAQQFEITDQDEVELVESTFGKDTPK